MGILSDMFGMGKTYSSKPKQITSSTIQSLVSKGNVRSVDYKEEPVIEAALIAARNGGALSMQNVYKTLQKLEANKKISKHDRQGIMKVFQTYFNS